jgi:hypothetical protein
MESLKQHKATKEVRGRRRTNLWRFSFKFMDFFFILAESLPKILKQNQNPNFKKNNHSIKGGRKGLTSSTFMM